MALSCFERALPLGDDVTQADIWYNIGHVGIGIGDLGLAYQAFKISMGHLRVFTLLFTSDHFLFGGVSQAIQSKVRGFSLAAENTLCYLRYL